MTQVQQLKAVDFFCGGGGMSCGMQQAGLKIIAGIDYDINCKDTYEHNIKAPFIHADVTELSEVDLEKTLNITPNDDNLVMIGCSPCQFWSIIRTDKKKSQKSKNLLQEFRRFVVYFNPGYVVVENVPGILRKKDESGLQSFIDWLEANNYTVNYKVVNTNDYGVPQNRKRFTLIANRISSAKLSASKTDFKAVVKDFIGVQNGFPEIKAGHMDNSSFNHSVSGLGEINLRRLAKIRKNGGTRFDFANDPELQLECFVGKDDSFRDTFGRLWWDKPSSTITTKFINVSCGRFVHPEENRGLSIREGATLQTFPKNFHFITNALGHASKLIGNAVPPEYAKRIALSIVNNHS
jgi:DNA (cytosine-5)-methyltransferase 1